MKNLGKFINLFLVGVGIGTLVEVLISIFIGQITVGVPLYFSKFDSLILARILEILFYGGFSIVGNFSARFYRDDSNSILKASLMQFIILFIYFSFAGYFLCWFRSLYVFLGAFAIFLFIFFSIWTLIFLIEKKKIEKINKKFSN